MLRLFTEQEGNERAFEALTRFLDVLDERPRRRPAALDPLALSFQLKLLWLSGYLPHLTSCAECGAADGPRRLLAARRRGRLPACASGAMRSRSVPEGLAGIEALLASPLAERSARARRARRREALA